MSWWLWLPMRLESLVWIVVGLLALYLVANLLKR
jgi:hypothetical protein